MSYKNIMNQISKNQIKNIYLFYGEETYLMDHVLERIKKELINPSFQQLNFVMLEGKDLHIEALIDACETLPFMAEKKLVYIKKWDLFEGKSKVLSESDEKYIAEYISRIPPTTVLIFYGHPAIDKRRKIVKEIEKHGEVVEFTKLNEEEFNSWIKSIFKTYNKSIGAKELAIIKNSFDYLGKNASQSLLDVENEIKKLVAFMGDKREVQAIHIEKVLGSSFQNNIFKLMDSIEKGNASESIKRLNHMLQEGEPTLKILTTLGNQIKNILLAKLLLEEGYTSKSIASKLGVHPFVASKCAEQSKKFTTERLREILNDFLDADLMIKSGKMEEKIVVEMLIMKICQ